jgi:DNA polymerase (family 10)
MIGSRPGIELDLDAIFAAAEATGTALEVNGSLPRLDMSVEALRRAQLRSVDLVMTSDAHHIDELSRIDNAVQNAERAWIAPERVLNVGSEERLVAWTRAKRPAAAS